MGKSMKVVVQRVKNANVKVEDKIIGEIGRGIVVFLGIGLEDVGNESKIDKVIDKLINLRIYEDSDDKMNLSTLDIDGEVLVISNFTLYADARKGTRPSYSMAARPNDAEKMYDLFLEKLKNTNIKNVQSGSFGADMEVNVVNDGPVTIIYEL